MTIDEAIERCKNISKHNREIIENINNEEDKRETISIILEHEQLADWLEELKSYQQLDLEIPQHFTKEQSIWIKKYCIERNKEFYNQALEDFRKKANDFLNESSDFADFVITDNDIDCICNELRKE